MSRPQDDKIILDASGARKIIDPESEYPGTSQAKTHDGPGSEMIMSAF
jgi:hypothetical protein